MSCRQKNTGHLTLLERPVLWETLVDVFMLPTLLAVAVWFSARVGYLLAHTLAEVFSIVVAMTALVVATTARQFTRNHFVIFVAVAIGWCAGLDIIHTVVFKGMQLLPSDSANPPTQLWIAARFIQAVAMVVAPLMLSRQLKVFWLHLIFGVVSIAAVLAIASGHFPDAFIDGQGLTPFKIHTEYLIITLFAISLLLLWQRRHLTTPRLLWGITASLLVMMASEFAFTRYASVYAQANLVGHILKVYAYWFVYLALVQTTLREPFSMLARAASTYDAVPDPTLVVSADGTILQANRAAAQQLGRPVEELVGGSSHALFHPQEVPVALCPVCTKLSQPGAHFLQVLELPGFRFVECSVAPYVEDEGEAYVQVLRDVTEQHASEERFRKLFEDTHQAVTLAVNGHFVAANRAALGMLGMTQLEQLLGRTPPQISPERQPDGRRSVEKVEEVIATAFAQGGNEFEWEHLRVDGSSFIARVLVTPIRMGGKDVLHVVWSDITEQKKTESELHDYRLLLEQRVQERTAELESLALRLGQSNAQQQAVFDAAAVGILLTRDRVITHCNRTLERMFGYEANELLGGSTAILYPDNETFLQIGVLLKELFSSDQVFSRELEMPRKDGSLFLARLSIQAIDRSDPDKGVAGTIADISAERAAEDALRRSHDHIAAIFDSANTGILMIRNRRIEECNKRLETMTGYTRSELMGSETRLLYLDEAAWMEGGKEIYGCLARGEHYAREQQVRRKDGSVFWARLSAGAIDPDDLSKGAVGMLEDATAEHVATEALNKASEEQQAVFNAATVGIVLTRERLIQRCNRTMELLFGYELNELIGKTTRVLYTDDLVYAEVGRLQVAALGGQGYYREERELVRKDGSRFWCRKMVRAIDRDDLGKGFASTFEDITIERAAMEEMSRARRMAEDLVKTKADFLANMSHEIRTPMNSVIGMTYLALKADPSPKISDYLRKIQSSSQHLLGVINDILDFSKLEADKMLIEHASFDLEKVLENITSLVAESVSSKGLELLIDVAAEVQRQLVGDSLRIEQVLINLANNAVKFTEHGSITIRVSAKPQEANEVELYFAVQDTGIGIGEAERALLFQSFQQADTSTTRKYGGSGLGLAISKRLVELMGGKIGVESAPGAGSTFWFTVRLEIGQEGVSYPRLHASLQGLKALVVDDNEQARQVIVEMLRGMGLEAMAVASGESAIAEIELADSAGVQYDLVLLDWKMPGMNGVEVARELLRRPLQKQPIILMVTAFDRDELLSAAAQMGIREVLVKPLTPSSLFNGLLRHVGAADECAVSAAAETEPLDEIGELVGARALLVEDNELNQEVAREFLKAFGLVVDIAEDGLAGVQKLREHRYDVVLMDMQMPVMDGLSATREIRRMPQFAELPIIAMTANAMAGDCERCLAAGMNDHIAKPIAPGELVAKLRHWVHRPVAVAVPTALPAPAVPLAQTGPYQGRLEDLPGIDIALGLSHVAGREALYRKVLRKFVDTQGGAPLALAGAIAGARWEEAERLAHTLKGVAAQIGAGALRELAEQLEMAIRARRDLAELENLRQALARPLALLVAALSGAA